MSFGHTTTAEEIDDAIAIFVRVAERSRSRAGIT
jgi:hypothetical protein